MDQVHVYACAIDVHTVVLSARHSDYMLATNVRAAIVMSRLEGHPGTFSAQGCTGPSDGLVVHLSATLCLCGMHVVWWCMLNNDAEHHGALSACHFSLACSNARTLLHRLAQPDGHLAKRQGSPVSSCQELRPGVTKPGVEQVDHPMHDPVTDE